MLAMRAVAILIALVFFPALVAGQTCKHVVMSTDTACVDNSTAVVTLATLAKSDYDSGLTGVEICSDPNVLINHIEIEFTFNKFSTAGTVPFCPHSCSMVMSDGNPAFENEVQYVLSSPDASAILIPNGCLPLNDPYAGNKTVKVTENPSMMTIQMCSTMGFTIPVGQSEFEPLGSPNSFSNYRDTSALGSFLLEVSDSKLQDPMCHVGATLTVYPYLGITSGGSSPPSCNGLRDGSITLNVCGGSTSYIISDVTGPGIDWATDSEFVEERGFVFTNSITVIGFPPGTFTFHVEESGEPLCSQTFTETVDAKAALSYSISSKDGECFGEFGSINANAESENAGGFELEIDGPGGVTTFGPLGDTEFNHTVTSLSAGSYDVTIRDANNCTAMETEVISIPSEVTFTVSPDDITCPGANDGEIEVTATGGSGSYTSILFQVMPFMQLSSIALTAGLPGSFTGLTPQDYDVRVQDSQGCPKSPADQRVTISEPGPFSTSLSISTHPTCPEDTDGELDITISGGQGLVSYEIRNSDMTTCHPPDVSGISTPHSNSGLGPVCGHGNYTITVTDSQGCTATDSDAVVVPDTWSVSVSQTAQSVCAGDNTNSLTATANEVPPQGGAYTFTLSGTSSAVQMGNPSVTFTNLAPGPYKVATVGPNGCASLTNATITITEPAAIAASVVSVTDTSCSPTDDVGNIMDGRLRVSTSGAVPFSWIVRDAALASVDSGTMQASSPFNTNTVLSAGDYTVQVTDANGCVANSTSATVDNPTPLNLMVTDIDPKLHASCEARIRVTLSGGQGGGRMVTDGMTSSSSPAVFNYATVGSHTLTVSNSAGCERDFMVTSIETLHTFNLQTVDGMCNGDASDFTITKATGPQTLFDFEQTVPSGPTVNNAAMASFSIVGSSGGTNVQFEVTFNAPSDPTNCVVTLTGTARFLGSALSIADSNTNPTCDGDSDGEITVQVNGDSPFTIVIDGNSNGGTTNPYTVGSLSAGTYRWNVTDNRGCSESGSRTLSDPTPPSLINVNVITNACPAPPTGGIQGSVSGAFNPFTVELNPGMVTQSTNGAWSFGSLAAGIYTINVTDNNGCPGAGVRANVTNRPLAISAVDDVSCNGTIPTQGIARVVFTATGGQPPYSFSITPGGMCAGNGAPMNCGSCPGCCSANTGAFEIDPYVNDCTYTVRVTDSNGCVVTDTWTPTIPDAIDLIGVVTHLDCNCTGGTPCPTGKINVTSVTGGNSLSYQLTLSPGGIVMNHVEPGSTLFDMLDAGMYSITAEDAFNCQRTFSFTINEPGAPVSFTDNNNATTCNSNDGPASSTMDGIIRITPAGGTPGYTYTIGVSPPVIDANATGVSPGTYTVDVTDSLGCAFSGTTTVGQPTAIMATFNPTGTTCNSLDTGFTDDGSALLQSSTAYTWIDLSGFSTICASTMSCSYTGLGVGSYNIRADDGTCHHDYSPAFSVSEPAAITFTHQDVSCDTTAYIRVRITSGVGSHDIEINDGSVTVYGSASGVGVGVDTDINIGSNFGAYTVVVTRGPCSQSATGSTAAPAALSLAIDSVTEIQCNGGTGSMIVSFSGGLPPYTISYSGGVINNPPSPQNIPGLGPGTETVTLTDSSPCALNDMVMYDFMEPTTFSLSGTITHPSCFGATDGSVALMGSGGTTPYTTLNSGMQPTSGMGDGSTTYNALDANNCPAMFTAVLNEPTEVVLSLTAANATCAGRSDGSATASVVGGTPNGMGQYTFDIGGPSVLSTSPHTFSGLGMGTYTVSVVDSVGGLPGCMDSAMISVGELSVSASAIATDESSAGASDGQIEVTVSGGTASYTVALSGGASPPSQSIPTSGGSTTFMSLPAGTYTVDVTDNAGCTTQLTGVVVSTTPLVSFNATLTPLRCASDDAQIDVVVDTMTGTAPYTIRLTGVISGVQTVMASAATFTMLEADQYTVEVSDAAMNMAPPVVFNVTVGTILSMTLTDASCTTDPMDPGMIRIDVFGGTAPYDAHEGMNSYGPFDPTTTITVPTLGMAYTVNVTDSTIPTCKVTDTITPMADTLAVSYTFTQVDSLCHIGPATGYVNVSASGGTPPYTAELTNIDTEVPPAPFFQYGVITQVPKGTHTLHVADSNGCGATDTMITINGNLPLFVNIGEKNISKCRNDATAVLAVGSTAPIFDVRPPPLGGFGDSDIFGAAGGVTYNVTVMDDDGCLGFNSYTVVNPPELLVPVDVLSPVTCFGDSDGQIQIQMIGGEPPYLLTITPAPTGFPMTSTYLTDPSSVVISDLSAQSFDIVVEDNRGCVKRIDDFSLDQPGRLELIAPKKRDNWFMYQEQHIQWVYNGGGRDDFVDVWLRGGQNNLNGFLKRLQTFVSARRGSIRGFNFLPHHMVPGKYEIVVNGTCVDEYSGEFYLMAMDSHGMGNLQGW